jgi:protein TonB
MKYSLILPALFLLIFSNFGMAQTVEKPRESTVTVEETVQMVEEPDFEVPIAIVEVPPIYPGCTASREESIKCLFEKINEKFNKEFVFPSSLEKKEQRIFVSFNVSHEGVVKIAVLRSPHKDIDEQVKKVFSDFPQLFPGTQRNKPVVVTFLVPFTLNKGL